MLRKGRGGGGPTDLRILFFQLMDLFEQGLLSVKLKTDAKIRVRKDPHSKNLGTLGGNNQSILQLRSNLITLKTV